MTLKFGFLIQLSVRCRLLSPFCMWKKSDLVYFTDRWPRFTVMWYLVVKFKNSAFRLIADWLNAKIEAKIQEDRHLQSIDCMHSHRISWLCYTGIRWGSVVQWCREKIICTKKLLLGNCTWATSNWNVRFCVKFKTYLQYGGLLMG